MNFFFSSGLFLYPISSFYIFFSVLRQVNYSSLAVIFTFVFSFGITRYSCSLSLILSLFSFSYFSNFLIHSSFSSYFFLSHFSTKFPFYVFLFILFFPPIFFLFFSPPWDNSFSLIIPPSILVSFASIFSRNESLIGLCNFSHGNHATGKRTDPFCTLGHTQLPQPWPLLRWWTFFTFILHDLNSFRLTLPYLPILPCLIRLCVTCTSLYLT